MKRSGTSRFVWLITSDIVKLLPIWMIGFLMQLPKNLVRMYQIFPQDLFFQIFYISFEPFPILTSLCFISISITILYLGFQKWCHLYHMSWRNDLSEEISMWPSISCALSSVMVGTTEHMSHLQSAGCTSWECYINSFWKPWTTPRIPAAGYRSFYLYIFS